jgi:CDP-diacylglycerol--glycerol-3-phosphate 3-phosphatidyltransferase
MIDGRRDRDEDDQQVAPHRSLLSRLDIGARVASLGISANAITTFGIVLAAGFCVAVGTGRFWIGVALIIIGGLMDTLDGVVAKAAGTSSPRGAFFDSVADRVSDALMFSGAAWYLLDGPHPKEALIPVAILAVGAVISYERAKAESLGFDARGGLMERAERLIVLGLAILFHIVLVPILLALLVLTTATALGRFVRVWRQATPGAPSIGVRRELGPGRVESRWRTWRETGRTGPSRPRTRTRKRSSPEPLATRLRSVLSNDRPQRSSRTAGAARQRSARAVRRRVDSDN